MWLQMFGPWGTNGAGARNVVANSSHRQLQAVHSGSVLQTELVEAGQAENGVRTHCQSVLEHPMLGK